MSLHNLLLHWLFLSLLPQLTSNSFISSSVDGDGSMRAVPNISMLLLIPWVSLRGSLPVVVNVRGAVGLLHRLDGIVLAVAAHDVGKLVRVGLAVHRVGKALAVASLIHLRSRPIALHATHTPNAHLNPANRSLLNTASLWLPHHTNSIIVDIGTAYSNGRVAEALVGATVVYPVLVGVGCMWMVTTRAHWHFRNKFVRFLYWVSSRLASTVNAIGNWNIFEQL